MDYGWTFSGSKQGHNSGTAPKARLGHSRAWLIDRSALPRGAFVLGKDTEYGAEMARFGPRKWLEGKKARKGIVWDGCAFVILPRSKLHTLKDRPSHDIKLRDSPRGRGQKRVQLLWVVLCWLRGRLRKRAACTCRAESPGRRERPDIPNDSPLTRVEYGRKHRPFVYSLCLSFCCWAPPLALLAWIHPAPLPSPRRRQLSPPAVQPSAVDRPHPLGRFENNCAGPVCVLGRAGGRLLRNTGALFSSDMVTTIIANEHRCKAP